jgi:hypothetical protein
METLIAQAEAMKGLLTRISRCQCETLVQCGRSLARTRQSWIASRKSKPALRRALQRRQEEGAR